MGEKKDTELLEAKGALEASEQRYRELVDLAPIGIFRSTRGGRFLSVNPALVSLLGYDSRDEMLRLDLGADVYVDGAERDRRMREVEITGRSGFEVRWKRRDGSPVWVLLDSRVIRGGSGAIEQFEGFVHDIQKRKDAEEALRGSEERYRLLFEKNPEPMFAFDENTLGFLAVNDAAIRTYGYSAKEFLSMTLEEIRPAEDTARLLETVHVTEAGYAEIRDVRHHKKDGSLIDVEIAAQPLEFSGRRARLVLAKNVTERKRAEAALRASEARYRALFEYAPDGIVIADPESFYIDANASMCRMLGYTRDELVGLHASDIVTQTEIEHIGTALGAIKAKSDYHREWQFRRKDGSVFAAEVIATTMPDGNLLGIIRDITEKKRLEAQILQAQKMEAVGQLAGGVAHDFNNVLTAILGYGSLLASRLAPDAPGREEVDEILHASHRAAALTRQLLAFSRRQVLKPVVLSINELIANFEKMLGRLIGEDVNLIARLDPFLGNVRADRVQLEQVIMNLAVNARDAMPNGGRLTIETANADLDESCAQHPVAVQPGRYVMVAVSDTGSGMDEETQARVFEPFFTTKEKGKGTGLGLATVYGIVKQSGGYIWVYSEPGKGTTFKVYLPRVEETTAQSAPPSADSLPRVGAETILLVEDEPAVRNLSRRVLEEDGYRVLEASSGKDALERIRGEEGRIHLLLTDLVMPDMGGTELASRLEGGQPTMRVLFMSGYTDDAVVRNGLLGPGRAFLQKPFTPGVLARKVREILS